MIAAFNRPRNWQDFELLCWALWKRLLNDPMTKLNGRKFDKQHGVDVYGCEGGDRSRLVGIQCKGMENYDHSVVAKSILLEEIEKAKTFIPPLSKWILASTSARSSALDHVARTITEDHTSRGMFEVHLMFWNDIEDRLREYPEIASAYNLHVTQPSSSLAQVFGVETSLRTPSHVQRLQEAMLHTRKIDAKKTITVDEADAEVDRIYGAIQDLVQEDPALYGESRITLREREDRSIVIDHPSMFVTIYFVILSKFDMRSARLSVSLSPKSSPTFEAPMPTLFIPDATIEDGSRVVGWRYESGAIGFHKARAIAEIALSFITNQMLTETV